MCLLHSSKIRLQKLVTGGNKMTNNEEKKELICPARKMTEAEMGTS